MKRSMLLAIPLTAMLGSPGSAAGVEAPPPPIERQWVCKVGNGKGVTMLEDEKSCAEAEARGETVARIAPRPPRVVTR